MKNIDKFLIGIGVLNILLGLYGVLKEHIYKGILGIFIGIFLIGLVIKDRIKRKKEVNNNETI